MTSQDHNKTLEIIYSFLGGLFTLAALIELVRIIVLERELARIQSDSALQIGIIVALVFMVFLYLTAYGLFKKRRWARISALISSGLFVWLVPLGTALAIYAWWFLQGESGRQLYSKSST